MLVLNLLPAGFHCNVITSALMNYLVLLYFIVRTTLLKLKANLKRKPQRGRANLQ